MTLYLAIKSKFPATESKGENSVTDILMMNLLKRSQTLQDNTTTRTDNTTVPAIVSGIYQHIFETKKPLQIIRWIQDFLEEDLLFN